MRKTPTQLLSILLAVLVQPLAVVADNMSPALISGQVVYHERVVMPVGTGIRITLEDVSRGADAARRGVDFRAVGNEPPWQIEIIRGRHLQMTAGYDGKPVRTP